MIRDLDELVLACRSDEARHYIAEAVKCYKAGAFRASIVSTWIAVVYDLLEKISELSLGGDAEAQKITEELRDLQPKIQFGDKGAIGKILEIERNIVQIASEKFGFFDGQQLIDLKRIQDDRNRCAHPTYQGTDQLYSPSAELARTHLVHAVEHVLSVPPVQGKAATAHIVKLVESDYFPVTLEQAKTQLKLGGLERPKDSLVRSVTDHLVFGMFEEGSKLRARRQTAMALRAVYDLFPGLAEPRLRKALNTIGRKLQDEDQVLFFQLQEYLPPTWKLLEKDNQTRLQELIRQSPDQVAILILPICFDVPDLIEVCRERLGALGYRSTGQLLSKTNHSEVINRAVDIYCSSKSWEQANLHYSHVIVPILDELNQDHIRRILYAPTKERADLIGAHSFSTFIQHIYDNDKLPRQELIDALNAQDILHKVRWEEEECPF